MELIENKVASLKKKRDEKMHELAKSMLTQIAAHIRGTEDKPLRMMQIGRDTGAEPGTMIRIMADYLNTAHTPGQVLRVGFTLYQDGRYTAVSTFMAEGKSLCSADDHGFIKEETPQSIGEKLLDMMNWERDKKVDYGVSPYDFSDLDDQDF